MLCWGESGSYQTGTNSAKVSSVKCHLSTTMAIFMHQLEDRCHKRVHAYTNSVSKYVYRGSNVFFLVFYQTLLSQDVDEPERIASTVLFKEVSCGHFSCCAIATNDDIYCWGSSTYGNIPNGEFSKSYSRCKTIQLSMHEILCCSEIHIVSIFEYVFDAGNLQKIPAKITNLCDKGIVGLAVSYHHSCAYTSAGRVYCFGSSGNGVLGIGEVIAAGK